MLTNIRYCMFFVALLVHGNELWSKETFTLPTCLELHQFYDDFMLKLFSSISLINSWFIVFDCAGLQVDQWPIRTDHRSIFSTRDTENMVTRTRTPSVRMFTAEIQRNMVTRTRTRHNQVECSLKRREKIIENMSFRHIFLKLSEYLISFFISCPGQLNRWPCHWLTHWLSDSSFDFSVTLDTSRH